MIKVSAGLALFALSVATPAAAEGWSTRVLDDFVPPDGRLVIFGAMASDEESVTLSCVLDTRLKEIRKLFLDVTIVPGSNPSLAEGTLASLSIGQEGRTPTDFNVTLETNRSDRTLVSVNRDLEEDLTKMLDLVQNVEGDLPWAISVQFANAPAVSFALSGKDAGISAQEFVDACIPPEQQGP